MKHHLHNFIAALRVEGLAVPVSSTLDAMRAVGVVGVERDRLREALAATIVKDHTDRATFDAVFERFFAAPERPKRRSRPHTYAGEGSGSGKAETGEAGSATRPNAPAGPNRSPAAPPRESRHPEREHDASSRLARARAVRAKPLRDLLPDEIEECELLVAELAEQLQAFLRRRQRHARRGRVDIRRTLRRSIATGGVPLAPMFKARPPAHPDLLALCDLSHSVATASRFFLSLLAPADQFFRRVRLLGFVDRPVGLSLEKGMLVTHGPLDLQARSDFGKVLTALSEDTAAGFSRNTLLLILGDARNNRRPPRADLLQRIRRSVREVVWLNPETRSRWDTGDSVMHAYEPYCDAVLNASTLAQLSAALRQAFRRL